MMPNHPTATHDAQVSHAELRILREAVAGGGAGAGHHQTVGSAGALSGSLGHRWTGNPQVDGIIERQSTSSRNSTSGVLSMLSGGAGISRQTPAHTTLAFPSIQALALSNTAITKANGYSSKLPTVLSNEVRVVSSKD